jgi:hypothetical protein
MNTKQSKQSNQDNDKYKKDYNKAGSQFDWDNFQKQAPSVDFLTPELFVLMLKNI